MLPGGLGAPGLAADTPQPRRADTVAGLSLDDLRALPELSKPHYSYPMRNDWLDPLHPFLVEYVRITHAVGIGPAHCERHVRSALTVCRQVNARAPRIPAVLAVNLSPYHEFKPAAADFGTAHDQELNRAARYFENVSGWLREFNEGGAPVTVGAVLLNCERYDFRTSNSPELNNAIIRKYDAIYSLAKRHFPEAVVEWYRRGGVNKVEQPPDWHVKWLQYPRFSGRERGDTFSCQLYRVPELAYEREALERTAGNAAAAGVPMNVWLSLGAGYRRALTSRTGERYDIDWDYDPVHSWMIGFELHRRPNVPQAIIFYPGAFDPRVTQWGKHFAAYVRGAARRLPSAAEQAPAGAGGAPPFNHGAEWACQLHRTRQTRAGNRQASYHRAVVHAYTATTAE